MTAAVANEIDFAQYTGKKVIVTRNTVDENNQPIAVEITGTCQIGNETGLVIKPRGKSGFDLIEASEIEHVVLDEAGDKKIKASKLKPVALGKARSHLLERHAVTLTEANSMTEEEAFNAHAAIDHVAEDLGHVHGTDDETPSELAE